MKLSYLMYAMMVSEKEAASEREERDQARHEQLLSILQGQASTANVGAEDGRFAGAASSSVLLQLRKELQAKSQEICDLREEVLRLRRAPAEVQAVPEAALTPSPRPSSQEPSPQRSASAPCAPHAVWGTAGLPTLLDLRAQDDADVIVSPCTCGRDNRRKTLKQQRRKLSKVAEVVAAAKHAEETVPEALKRLSTCYRQAVAMTHPKLDLRGEAFDCSLATAVHALNGDLTQASSPLPGHGGAP